MSGCIFCKVAAGEIPAEVVKQGNGMLAFRDVNPQAPTHLLIIPTTHIGSLNDAKDPQLLGARSHAIYRACGLAQAVVAVIVDQTRGAIGQKRRRGALDGALRLGGLPEWRLAGRPWPPARTEKGTDGRTDRDERP
jgi:hypothetical protein